MNGKRRRSGATTIRSGERQKSMPAIATRAHGSKTMPLSRIRSKKSRTLRSSGLMRKDRYTTRFLRFEDCGSNHQQDFPVWCWSFVAFTRERKHVISEFQPSPDLSQRATVFLYF